jgi:hypothetical protein
MYFRKCNVTVIAVWYDPHMSRAERQLPNNTGMRRRIDWNGILAVGFSLYAKIS